MNNNCQILNNGRERTSGGDLKLNKKKKLKRTDESEIVISDR